MSTLLTAAGAIDRRAVMCRAWDLMRRVYQFGQLRFSSIGRQCLGWCVRKAWAEARDEISRWSIPAAEKAARIADLRRELSSLVYIDDWRHADRRRREIEEDILWLAA